MYYCIMNEADEVQTRRFGQGIFFMFDSEGRTSAFTTIPEIAIGKYAWLKVVDSNPKVGVFLDIGLKKDLLLGIDDLPVHKSVL